MPTIVKHTGWGGGPWGTPTKWGADYLNIVPDNVTATGRIGAVSSGLFITGSIGTVSVTAAGNISVTGVTLTMTLGGITVWSNMDEGQTPGFSEVSTSQTADWENAA
jgi:hypothetical protein|tara:strand:- start:1372 stop:1692 length:321 start_codon:yes stop_codon:yes gene_type:complete